MWLVMLLLFPTLQATIIVRHAVVSDYEQLIDLDCRVTYEFFRPLFSTYYSHYAFGQNPDYYLAKELASDRATFMDYILQKDARYRLWIAYDTDKNNIGGFLLCHKQAEQPGEIDLFLVDQAYRRQGLGRALFQAAVKDFSSVTHWIVEPFAHGNDATIRFYESLGFVNDGFVHDTNIGSYGVSRNQLYIHMALRTDFLKD